MPVPLQSQVFFLQVLLQGHHQSYMRRRQILLLELPDLSCPKKSRQSNEVEQAFIRCLRVAHRAEVCCLPLDMLRACCTADGAIELCTSVAGSDYQWRTPPLTQGVEQIRYQRRKARFRLRRRGVVYPFPLGNLRGGEFLNCEVPHIFLLLSLIVSSSASPKSESFFFNRFAINLPRNRKIFFNENASLLTFMSFKQQKCPAIEYNSHPQAIIIAAPAVMTWLHSPYGSVNARPVMQNTSSNVMQSTNLLHVRRTARERRNSYNFIRVSFPCASAFLYNFLLSARPNRKSATISTIHSTIIHRKSWTACTASLPPSCSPK